MADQWVAGFANAVTFGATTYIRSNWYGETATQNHSGFMWNMGQLAGLGSSLLIGGASPHALKFSMSGTQWFATTHAVSGTAVSAWETGTHLREGRLEWTDAFTLLPLVSYAASSEGMRQFIGAARAVTERLRDWGQMKARAYFEAGYRSAWTSETGAILLPAGRPGTVIRNKLDQHEFDFAQDIIRERGGQFIGQPTRDLPGIDGTLNGVPISLKETKGGLGAILRHVSKAEEKARNAGYQGIEVYVKAPNVDRASLLDFAQKGPLMDIPNQGTISSINVRTSDGWVQITGR